MRGKQKQQTKKERIPIMKYIVEQSLAEFKAWSGGKDWLEQAIENGTVEQVESFIESLTDGREEPLTEVEINDLLWFDDEVHDIIERGGDVVDYLRNKFPDLADNFSDEALEYIADNLIDDMTDKENVEKVLESHEEFETIADAVRVKELENEDELNDYYEIVKLVNGNILTD